MLNIIKQLINSQTKVFLLLTKNIQLRLTLLYMLL